MLSKVTIDGVEFEHGDPIAIAGIYTLVAQIIRSGNTETLIFNSSQGDYETRRTVLVTPRSTLSAAMAVSPADEFPLEDFSDNIAALSERYENI